MVQNGGIQIFLAHASGDKPAVLKLYERLQATGYSPWLDKKNLIPGQNWQAEIPKAIKDSDLVIACLSNNSVSKQGYVQQELRMALMEYARRPTNRIYLIPLRLEPCEIPDLQLPQLGMSLRDFHWLDYWEPDGFNQLIRAIEHQPLPSAPGRSRARAVPRKRSNSVTTAAPSVGVHTSRRRLLSLLALGGVGTVSVALWEMLRGRLPASQKLQTFKFETVKVDAGGRDIDRRERSAQYFRQDLGNGVMLDMVAIPGGRFLMGSPADEAQRDEDEGPQHNVDVPDFFTNL